MRSIYAIEGRIADLRDRIDGWRFSIQTAEDEIAELEAILITDTRTMGQPLSFTPEQRKQAKSKK